MGDPTHRLAVHMAAERAQTGEAARRQVMAPDGDGVPGVELATASATDLACLGLAAGADLEPPPFPAPPAAEQEEAQ
jgi:hypothetical protein